MPAHAPEGFVVSPPAPPAASPRLEIAPCDLDAVCELERSLGVSEPIAQILVRRGLGDPAAARAWLAADESHPPSAFADIEGALALMLRHVAAGSRITVHGDYDVDGVCATAILVRALRRLGADVDWYLPSRLEDGYGLAHATVARLAARGTRLLVTADCAITAVDEVVAARALGIDVLVTDHHAPRADGRLPDAPIVHPAICGYPCTELCATAVAYKLAQALSAASDRDPAECDEDLDLVGLATLADVVPLRGENRRLVRAGLRTLSATAKPGLRELMRVARVDPSRVDARAVGFGLAPRINAAGRLYRADAGLELVLTEDRQRAAQIAAELDAANAERRHVETRILFEAEAQVAAAGRRRIHVLAGEGWHPGVIGIVAARIAERHHRPAVLIALDGERGTGSCRSIPGFDVLGALTATGDHLDRFGGHRAAAGLQVARERVPALRQALEAHAELMLSDADLIPVERIDAVVGGSALGLELAEQIERLGPFGAGNPGVNLLVRGALLSDPAPLGEGRHVRFTVDAGGTRARAILFGSGGRLPTPADVPLDVSFRLERNEWNGTVEPRLRVRCMQPVAPLPIEVLGEPDGFLEGMLAELTRDLTAEAADAALLHGTAARGGRRLHDRRGRGPAGLLSALVASGETVLAVCADVSRRRSGLAERLGGFALCSHAALERDPTLGNRFRHAVALDPPAHEHQLAALLGAATSDTSAHLAWGTPELRFAQQIHEQEYGLRPQLIALYRVLRDRGGAAGEELAAVLRGDGQHGRSAALAGRLVRILQELRLVSLDPARLSITVLDAERTTLERSPAFQVYRRRYEEGQRYLSEATSLAA